MYFWKKWTGRKRAGRGSLLRATITETQRRNYRASVEFPIVYSVEGRDGVRSAQANDLSAGGLRIIGDEDFREGTMLALRFTPPNELIAGVQLEREIESTGPLGRTMKRKIMVPPEPFGEVDVRAKVVIAFLNVRRRKFAHGAQFVGIDERTQEEIRRFIHIWQLRLIRERAHLRGE